MNGNQEDELTMFVTVTSTGDKYQSTWTSNAVFAATYNLFKSKVALIEQFRDAQILNTTGITTDKNAKREIMNEKLLFIINRLQSYATVVGDNDLLASTHYSATDLKRARDTEAIGIADTIVTKATAIVTNLASYGVTQVLIADLQTAITNYKTTIPKPRTAKAQTKNATENLAQLFKECNDLLAKRLDLDIEVFKTSKPDFYSQYWTSRVVIPTTGSISAVKGEIISNDSGEPISKASMTFTLISNGKKAAASANGNGNGSSLVKITGEKGKYRVPSLAEGQYDVLVHKMGFKDKLVRITVVDGECTDLNLGMDKE